MTIREKFEQEVRASASSMLNHKHLTRNPDSDRYVDPFLQGYWEAYKKFALMIDQRNLVIRSVLNDLPEKRDWLDPEVETLGRELVNECVEV